MYTQRNTVGRSRNREATMFLWHCWASYDAVNNNILNVLRRKRKNTCCL